MGHLGNPIGFRLNFEKKWIFNFFTRNLYYPETINNLINIRDYLYYYLTRKKILKSGICFSHLYLYKFLKKFYIRIYIYHIDLEKNSYDFINHLYSNYYTVYNQVNFKFVKNKTKQQLDTYFKLRDLSNSDLFVFYYTFVIFYQKKSKSYNEIYYLKNNTFITNLKLYYDFIIFNYIKILLLSYKKSILYKKFLIKWNRKQWKLKKNKKKERKTNKKLLFAAKDIINWLLNVDPKSKYRLKWNELSDSKKDVLEKCLRFGLKKKINNVFFSIFFKKKKFKFLKKFKLKRSKFILRKLVRKSYNDTSVKSELNTNFYRFLQLKKVKGLNIYGLFIYLAKKVWFEKVRNSKTLWRKWFIIFKHLKILSTAKFLSMKKSFIINIKNFFFFLYTFIYLSKNSKAKNSIVFNLRNSIYYTIYYGIYKNFFHPLFELMTWLLKMNIHLLDNSLDKDNIIFTYYFITNDNVTSQLISRYIGLKLKRGFTMSKTITPLKRELIRVAKKGWGTQKPYIIYHYKLMFKNKKIFLRQIIKRYIKFCYYFFFINFVKYYINNNVLIFPNMFKYIKRTLKKNQEIRIFFRLFFLKYVKLFYYLKYNVRKQLNFLLINWYHLIFILKQEPKDLKHWRKWQKKRAKFLCLIKKLYLNIIYPLILNYDKKRNWYQFITKNKSVNIMFLKNAFFNSMKLLNMTLCYKIKKIINSKVMFISAFFNKNLLNFNVLQSLWVAYKNINIRNIRQKYIPKYYSSIMGFKMVFKGRFSRKERASKIIWNMGKVPLNTLEAKIDYTFLTLPLKNSAMSIKIFIYRWPVFNIYKNIVKI